MNKISRFFITGARVDLINPFFAFALAVFAGGFLYLLKLSRLYSQYDYTLFWMMFFFSCLSIFFGVLFSKLLTKKTQRIGVARPLSKLNIYSVCIVMCLVFLIECLEFGGVPLIMSLQGRMYNYKEFGIQTVHVFFVSYSSIFAVVCFYRWLSDQAARYYLAGPFSVLLFNILMMGRGGLLIIFLSCMLVYLSRVKHLRSAMLYLPALVFSVIIAFGYTGDKRMLSSGYQDKHAILSIGQADEDFFNESLPSGLFWSYLYASSPYANLLNQDDMGNQGRGDFVDLIKFSILPDFISKYFSDRGRFNLYKITPELTVGTAFATSFVILGYAGVLALFVWYCIFCFLVLFSVRRTHAVPACGVLCSMSIFMLFDNMLIFSSYFLQFFLLIVLARLRLGSIRFI